MEAIADGRTCSIYDLGHTLEAQSLHINRGGSGFCDTIREMEKMRCLPLRSFKMKPEPPRLEERVFP